MKYFVFLLLLTSTPVFAGDIGHSTTKPMNAIMKIKGAGIDFNSTEQMVTTCAQDFDQVNKVGKVYEIRTDQWVLLFQNKTANQSGKQNFTAGQTSWSVEFLTGDQTFTVDPASAAQQIFVVSSTFQSVDWAMTLTNPKTKATVKTTGTLYCKVN